MYKQFPPNYILQPEDWVEIFKKENAIIKAFTDRWETKLSECETGVELYNFLKAEFDREFAVAKDKEFVRQKELGEYSIHESSINPYVAKGFAWFKRQRDFSLKEFLFFEFETADDLRTGTKEYNIFDTTVFTDEWTLVSKWQIQEKRFNEAVKGWAYSNYVQHVINANSSLKNFTHIQSDFTSKLDKIIEGAFSELRYEAFINDEDYKVAKLLINDFFENQAPYTSVPVQIKNKYKKKLAFALGEIWRAKTNEILSIEYLKFWTRSFSIFSRDTLNEKDVCSNNLYKYAISRT